MAEQLWMKVTEKTKTEDGLFEVEIPDGRLVQVNVTDLARENDEVEVTTAGHEFPLAAIAGAVLGAIALWIWRTPH